MANKRVNGFSLKALVDKGNNRVIFAESNEDFIDVLFSFFTMPMGTIIGLTRNQPPTVAIGCMNSLYESVENLDVRYLQTEVCKRMLLFPRSAAESHCRSLKLTIDHGNPPRYFLCPAGSCTASKYMLLSYYYAGRCGCGLQMNCEIGLSIATGDGGVFVKGRTRYIVSDELQVMPSSSAASFSLLSKVGVMEGSTIEEMAFDVGVDEVLNLLKCSLVGKTPLTEALLKQKPVLQLGTGNFNQGSYIQSQTDVEGSNGDAKICVKLMLSKSRKMVCYAEAGEDFVDLLFSFLTLPLGYFVKEMHGSSLNGCLDQLYKSILDLDVERNFKSKEHKAILVSPKLAPGFGYENQPLDVGEAHQPYYYGSRPYDHILTTDETLAHSHGHATALTFVDPKSCCKESGGGFVKVPTMFTVTDSLFITPISPISGISLLNKLKVPFSDIEERVVNVGKEEALRLLVASFVSESALTNAFILSEPTNAFISREPKQEH